MTGRLPLRRAMTRLGGWCGVHWGRVVLVGTPIIAAMLPLIAGTRESRCAYVIIVMAVYWMTNALPLPVTALIPVFGYPLLGVLPTGETCQQYFKGTVMMFLGGLAVAVAVEHSNLHKRIALWVILKIGQSPRRLMVGCMTTTMFLSMWISNTAATAMMVPIVDALLKELCKETNTSQCTSSDGLELKSVAVNMTQAVENSTPPLEKEMGDSCTPQQNGAVILPSDVENRDNCVAVAIPEAVSKPLADEDQRSSKTLVCTMFMLGVAFSANLGGTAFPTGTGPNLVLFGLLQSTFSEPTSVNFATWMAFNVPVMLVCELLTGVVLDYMFVGWGKNRKFPVATKERELAVRRIVERSYAELGPVSFHEKAVSLLFTILVFLWVFRSPGFVTGWADLLDSSDTIGNATPAMLIVCLLFIIPAKPEFWPFGSGTKATTQSSPGCLTWKAVEEGVPWGLILLMGGGFAMARGSAASGLSAWIGEQLRYFDALPHVVIVILLVTFATFLTEVVSNITTANICLPVVMDLAINIGMNPVMLTLPLTVGCSYALMIPVSNPPNAIVYNACDMRTTDMMKAGVVVKVGCLVVLLVFLTTLGDLIFDIHSFPEWANSTST